MKPLSRRFCVAPMMDWSDRHCRYFWRQLSDQALLYTEMVTTGALLHGDQERFLRYNPAEHPVALQLGGSDPAQLAQCTSLAAEWGYDEVNLNVGCPSDRVQSGGIGACLMAEPDLVRDCLAAMAESGDIPVTIKHRTGIDQRDSYQELCRFVELVAESGVHTFIVHARKAWLSGLSPRQNRELPPLHYDRVYQLKRDFPDFEFILNGGIEHVSQGMTHLPAVDGIMLGRAAYQDPWCLTEVDPVLFGRSAPSQTPTEAIHRMIPYIEEELSRGTRLHQITRHMLGLFKGAKGARAFRRHLSEHANQKAPAAKCCWQHWPISRLNPH